MISSAIAETIAMAIKNPFEVVKQNLQFCEFNSNLVAIKQIWKKRRWRGIFSGYSALLWREIPCSVIEMSLFEQFFKINM
jgi:hypothetical protein